jgi:hypothetical protein
MAALVPFEPLDVARPCSMSSDDSDDSEEDEMPLCRNRAAATKLAKGPESPVEPTSNLEACNKIVHIKMGGIFCTRKPINPSWSRVPLDTVSICSVPGCILQVCHLGLCVIECSDSRRQGRTCIYPPKKRAKKTFAAAELACQAVKQPMKPAKIPKKTDEKQDHYRRPCGRAPKGKEWCYQTGVWVETEPSARVGWVETEWLMPTAAAPDVDPENCEEANPSKKQKPANEEEEEEEEEDEDEDDDVEDSESESESELQLVIDLAKKPANRSIAPAPRPPAPTPEQQSASLEVRIGDIDADDAADPPVHSPMGPRPKDPEVTKEEPVNMPEPAKEEEASDDGMLKFLAKFRFAPSFQVLLEDGYDDLPWLMECSPGWVEGLLKDGYKLKIGHVRKFLFYLDKVKNKEMPL